MTNVRNNNSWRPKCVRLVWRVSRAAALMHIVGLLSNSNVATHFRSSKVWVNVAVGNTCCYKTYLLPEFPWDNWRKKNVCGGWPCSSHKNRRKTATRNSRIHCKLKKVPHITSFQTGLFTVDELVLLPFRAVCDITFHGS